LNNKDFKSLSHEIIYILKSNFMKKNLLIVTVILSLGVLFSGFSLMYPNGAPAGYTGSPGDNKECTQCHSGTATTVTGIITSNIPAAGYTPGSTYQITVTNNLTGSGKFGFELSPQKTDGTQLGTLVAGTGTKLVGGTKYITHLNATTSTSSWTFDWIAPASGSGTVNFYAAIAKNKPGPVAKSSISVNEAVAMPAGAGPITGPQQVCKNSAQNYSVGTIAGATSYVWTVPSGASITSGSGTASISVSFGSGAISGNISVHGHNSAGDGTSSSLAVTVNDVPAIPQAPTGPALVNLENTTASNYSTQIAGTYNWFIAPANAGNISGTTENAVVTWNALFTGTAVISLQKVNSCGASLTSPSFSTEVVNTTSVQTKNKSDILIYNAAPGQLKVVLKSEIYQPALRIYDLSGRLLLSKQITGFGESTISHSLKQGTYIINIVSKTAEFNKAIFIY
jgi:hypothetical protein